jgi:ferrochelatase
MRYWHPMSIEAARAVADFDPEKVVLVPLYPQYSTTTTGSSLVAWRAAAEAVGLNVPTSAVCCYPVQAGLISAQVALVRRAIEGASAHAPIRVLFSAHGLPERVVRGGDPYQRQIEATSRAVVAGLGIEGLDWAICYQSRVGPLKWIGPTTKDEVARAGLAGVGLVIVPIAFVSEHSETLVELDVEYRRHADECGVPVFERVPALGVAPDFIAGLADVVRGAVEAPAGLACEVGKQPCATKFRGCPMIRAQAQADTA